MPTSQVSKKRAAKITVALFFLCLLAIAMTDNWWPGIMLAVGLPLALKQYLLGKNYDMMISLLVFVGTYVTVEYDISWKVFLPILFTLGAIYVLFRELTEEDADEPEKEEDQNHEIEEKK